MVFLVSFFCSSGSKIVFKKNEKNRGEKKFFTGRYGFFEYYVEDFFVCYCHSVGGYIFRFYGDRVVVFQSEERRFIRDIR